MSSRGETHRERRLSTETVRAAVRQHLARGRKLTPGHSSRYPPAVRLTTEVSSAPSSNIANPLLDGRAAVETPGRLEDVLPLMRPCWDC